MEFVFDFFVLPYKMEKVPSVYFDTLVTLLELGIKVSSLFSNSLWTRKNLHCEKRPNGVSFKLFSDSLNMKRLSSTCLIHTRKIIWRVVSLTVGYLFFGSDGLFTKKEHSNHDWKSSLRYYFILFQSLGTKSYEKGPFGVLFSLFRLSKHELHWVFFHWTH